MGATSATMALEPLRKEALTDVDRLEGQSPEVLYESETSTDVQSEAMDPVPRRLAVPPLNRPFRQCHVIGTWDNFRDLHEMTWEGGAYRCCVMLGESAEESFQIVVDGLRTRQIYPSIQEASPHVAHSLRGPDKGGSGVFWTVGRKERDAAERDAAYDVVMSCPRGAPISVRWTKVGASGGPGAPSSGFEATMIASNRHVLERPLWKDATMTAPADVEGCESELALAQFSV